jgi:hypothetical protein
METYEEYLELELLITVGDKVMITSNIWADERLANGSLGVVEQIIYNPIILLLEPHICLSKI